MIPDVQSHFETPKKIGLSPQKSYDFLITLVAIMFLSGGYAIWFISTYLYAYDDTEYTYTPRVHRATAAEVAASTDMTGWQTYRNEEYGFEFKYPEGQEVSVSGSSIKVGTTFWTLEIETKNTARESVFDSNSGVVIEDTNFAGKKAREYECPNKNKCPTQLSKSRSIKLIDTPQNWGIDNEIFYFASGSSNLADQILSTFKFIP